MKIKFLKKIEKCRVELAYKPGSV